MNKSERLEKYTHHRSNSSQSLRESLPNSQSLNIRCKDISEHWGIIWRNFEKLLKTSNPLLLTAIPWNYSNLEFQMKYHSSHITSFNINLFPDYYDKRLHIRYINPTLPVIHSPHILEKYCMNQYLKSIPIKSLISTETKRTNKIPNYYSYNYGIKIINEKEYEDIVYTVHVPCMTQFENEEFPIISISFSMLIPANIGISSNTFLWDIFLDNLNLLFFQFQLKHIEEKGKGVESYKLLISNLTSLINNFDDYMLAVTSNQVKKEVIIPKNFPSEEFLSRIITSHITSFYSIIMFDEYSNSQYIYDICYTLDSPTIHNQPLSSPINPKLLYRPNPFFRTMCLSTFDENQYYSLPYPFCIVNAKQQTIVRSSSQSSILYFMQRGNYLLSKAAKSLGITDFIPLVVAPEIFIQVPLIPLQFNLLEFVKNINQKSSHQLLQMILFKYCDLLAMKAHILLSILNNKTYLNGHMTYQTIIEFKRATDYNIEELKLVLSILKFSEFYVVGVILEMLEKYQLSLKI